MSLKMFLSLVHKKEFTHNVILRRVRITIYAVGQHQILNITSVSVALVTRNAKRMRRLVLSSVLLLAVPYSPQYPINCNIFGGNVFENKTCFEFLQNICVKHSSFLEDFSEIFS